MKCEKYVVHLQGHVLKDQFTCLDFLSKVSGHSAWGGKVFLHKNEIKFSFQTMYSSFVIKPSLHSYHTNHSDIHSERYRLLDSQIDAQMLDCQEQKLTPPSCSLFLTCFIEQFQPFSSTCAGLTPIMYLTHIVYLIYKCFSSVLFLDPFEANN